MWCKSSTFHKNICLTICNLAWLDRTLIWAMPKHFVTRSEHTLDFHKICLICWLMNKSRTMSVCTRTFSNIRQTNSSFHRSLQVIKHGFMSTTLKKATVFLVYKPIISTHKNGQASSFHCEGHTDFISQHSWNSASPKDRNCELAFLLVCSAVSMENVRQYCIQVWCTGDWPLLHSSTPQSALSVHEFV
jgi:hypothetical protein